GDEPLDGTLERLRDRAGLREGEDTDEARGALVPGDGQELLEELGVALVVVEAGSTVARRTDARGAPEGLDLEARVVGERQRIRHAAVLDGLERGVGEEGAPRLGDVARDAEIPHRDDLQRDAGQELLELVELALVVGGDEELAHAGPSKSAAAPRQIPPA